MVSIADYNIFLSSDQKLIHCRLYLAFPLGILDTNCKKKRKNNKTAQIH